MSKLDMALLGISKYRKVMAVGYVVVLALIPSEARAAASGNDGGIAILRLMQQASFWIGLAVVIWGQ